MTEPIKPPAIPGEIVRFATRADFEAWLDMHHKQNPGIWLMIAKNGSTVPSITYAEAIEVALCFGWIDGQKARHDDQHWLHASRRDLREAGGLRSTAIRPRNSSRPGECDHRPGRGRTRQG